MKNWFRSHKKTSMVLGSIAGIIAGLFIFVMIMSFKPFTLKASFTPDPAGSYDEALTRIQAIQSEEATLDLHPECATRLLSDGEKTANVIVFLHGFTSCPEQFAQLGQEYFDLGYNVYIPRTPHHGFDDRRGEPLEGLTAEEIAAFAHQTADIAQGLGERVVVVGLSAGGAMTTYLAQERDDIDLAVPIAPFLGIKFIPHRLNRGFTNLGLALPNIWQWWNPVEKENNPTSAPYAYTRYPLHALLENMRLGFDTLEDARKNRPAAGQIIVITNDHDESINLEVVEEFEQTWRQHGDEDFLTYRFENSLALAHDLISPTRPGARVDLVYPKLFELIR
jgi:pimeloyl-ACP methyl ester carboxylesterase